MQDAVTVKVPRAKVCKVDNTRSFVKDEVYDWLQSRSPAWWCVPSEKNEAVIFVFRDEKLATLFKMVWG
jgi:hypothetical protein